MYVNIVIERLPQDVNQTLGICSIIKDGTPVFSALSLERGWRDNAQGVSCIPPGIYPMVLEYSDRFKRSLWEIKEVENRSECKFHAANFWHSLEGCVSLADSLGNIDSDDYLDLLSSRVTMKRFHKALEGCTNVKLIIR